MYSNQIRNIIGFTFNFHQQCDMNWEMESLDYILEKWEKYIGTDTKSNLFDLESLPLRDKIKTQKWIYTWKISDKEFSKVKEIIYLINRINYKALIYSANTDIRYWNLQDLIDEFSKAIDIEKVNKDLYNNNHEIIKNEIFKWLGKLENKRSYNLNLLV
jgi:hypothetical protein